MYFLSAQKGRNDWWRYLLGILAVLFGYMVIGSIPLSVVLVMATVRGVPMDLNAFRETYDTEAIGIDQNTGLIILLFPSVLSFFVLWGVMVWIHRKKTGEIASAENRIRWPRVLTGAVVWLCMLVAAELFFAFRNPELYSFRFTASRFFPLLAIALLLIPFQAWFEELLFRSYLLLGAGLLFRSRIVALLLTAVGFGLVHKFNPEVKEFGFTVTMLYYVGFGIFAGLLVILDNGIELAFGVHAINNIYSAVFVTYQSSVLKTPAMWSIDKINPWHISIAFLIMAVLFVYIMSKLYAWNDWKRLFMPIPKAGA